MNAVRALQRRPWTGYPIGLAGVAAVTAGLLAIERDADVISLAVCYQLVVLVVSGAFGAGAGIVTSVVSVAAFNWFFVPPVHTFSIADTNNWISLGVFAATALITSQLAAGFRRQRAESDARVRDADLLAQLARSALTDIGPDPARSAVAGAAAQALGVGSCTVVLEAEPDRAPGVDALQPTAGAGGFAIPLVAHGRALGLLEVGPPAPGQDPRFTRPGFAAAVGGLVALAVERSRLLAEVLEMESLRRSDELKTALLRSVSHEFRTPLTAVRTAAEALARDPAADDAGALLAILEGESERLERLVANLLDLSRLEAGALTVRRDWCDSGELVWGAVGAAAGLLDGRPVERRLDADLPLVRADAVFCERILVNLLANAVRHGAGPIAVTARLAGQPRRLEVAVEDHGPGPEPSLGDRLFSPFAAGRRTGGTGVGLALSRGLAEAQGGALGVERAGGVTRFVLSLPLEPVPEVV